MVAKDNLPWLTSVEDNRKRREIINQTVRNMKPSGGRPHARDGGSTLSSQHKQSHNFGFVPRKMINSLHMLEVADALQRGYIIKEGRVESQDRCCHVHKAFVSAGKVERDEKVSQTVRQIGHDKVYIKIVSKSIASPQYMEQIVYREAKVLAALPFHPCMVNMLETFETSLNFYQVTEYTESRPLQAVVTTPAMHPPDWEGPGLPEHIARALFHHVCEGLRHCHSHGVAHRNLSCENILVTTNLQAKLTGFFSAKQVPNKRHLVDDSIANVTYAAPEVIRGQPHDPCAADIWSLGVVLYVMLNGEEPFSQMALLHQAEHTSATKPHMLRALTSEAISLVQLLLQWDPRNRPAVDDVLADPWLTGLKCVTHKYPEMKQCSSSISNLPKRYFSPQTRVPHKFFSSKVADSAVVMVNQSRRETITLKSRRQIKDSSLHKAGMLLPSYVNKKNRNHMEGVLPHYMVTELGYRDRVESPRTLLEHPVAPSVADVSQVSDDEFLAWLAAGVDEEQLISPRVTDRSVPQAGGGADWLLPQTLYHPDRRLLPALPQSVGKACPVCPMEALEQYGKDKAVEAVHTFNTKQVVEKGEDKSRKIEMHVPSDGVRKLLPPLQKPKLKVSLQCNLSCGVEAANSAPSRSEPTKARVQMEVCQGGNDFADVDGQQAEPDGAGSTDQVSITYETSKRKTTVKISCNIEECNSTPREAPKVQAVESVIPARVKSLDKQDASVKATPKLLHIEEANGPKRDGQATISNDEMPSGNKSVEAERCSTVPRNGPVMSSDEGRTCSSLTSHEDNAIPRTSPNNERTKPKPLKTKFKASGSTSHVVPKSRKSEGILTGKSCKSVKDNEDVDQWCEQVLREYEKMARVRSLPLPDQYLTDTASQKSSTSNLSGKMTGRPATMPMRSPRDTNKYFSGSLGSLNEKFPTKSGSKSSVKSRHSCCSAPAQNHIVVPMATQQAARPTYRMDGYRSVQSPRPLKPRKPDILKIDFNEEERCATAEQSMELQPYAENADDTSDIRENTGQVQPLCKDETKKSNDINSTSATVDEEASNKIEVPESDAKADPASEGETQESREDGHVSPETTSEGKAETKNGDDTISFKQQVAPSDEALSQTSIPRSEPIDTSTSFDISEDNMGSARMHSDINSEDNVEKYVSLISIDESISGSVPRANTKLLPSLQPHNRDLFWYRHLYSNHSATLGRGRESLLSSEQIVSKNLMSVQDLPMNTKRAISLCSNYSLDREDGATGSNLPPVHFLNNQDPLTSVSINTQATKMEHNDIKYRQYKSHLTSADPEPNVSGVAKVRFPRRGQRLLKYRHKKGEVNRSDGHLPKLRVVLDEKNIPVSVVSDTVKYRCSSTQKSNATRKSRKEVIVDMKSLR